MQNFCVKILWYDKRDSAVFIGKKSFGNCRSQFWSLFWSVQNRFFHRNVEMVHYPQKAYFARRCHRHHTLRCKVFLRMIVTVFKTAKAVLRYLWRHASPLGLRIWNNGHSEAVSIEKKSIEDCRPQCRPPLANKMGFLLSEFPIGALNKEEGF